MKLIRYIIFLPIMIMIIGLVYNLIPLALFGLMSLNKFWLILLLFVFGGLSVTIFQLIPLFVAWISSKISPSNNFAFNSIMVISVLLGLVQISIYWNTPGIMEDGSGILIGLIVVFLTFGFAASFSFGAGVEMFEEKSNRLRKMFSIGTIIFYIGIFLIICLLSTKICYINPEKNYSWYSGIWHGIFVIPNWIASWFIDYTYCKAPKATTAYSFWWFTSFIFLGLGVFGNIFGRRTE